MDKPATGVSRGAPAHAPDAPKVPKAPEPFLRLAAGDATVDVHPAAGGRVGQIAVGERRLLRGWDDVDDQGPPWARWGSYPLAPWSNRVAGGRFRFDGVEHRLPINWPDGTAIHGLVADTAWTVASADASSACLTVAVDQPPFRLGCQQQLRVGTGRLDLTLTVVNEGAGAVPAGLGIHPWFRSGPLQLDAAEVWPTENLLPSGPPRPVGRDEDLRRPRRPPAFDKCFTRLGARSARMADLDLLWSDEVEDVIVYTGVPGWMCVEPVTHAVDGFNLATRGWAGHGVRTLAPGDELSVSFAFMWSDRADVDPAWADLDSPLHS